MRTNWNKLIEGLRGDLTRRAEQVTHRYRRRGFGLPSGEDLAHLVFVKLFSAYGENEMRTWPEGQVYGYAYRTLHNLIIDEGMRKSPALLGDLQNDDEDDRSPIEPKVVPEFDEDIDARGQQQQLRQCLERLPDNDRGFLVRSFELGSAPQAQQELGWPSGGATNACMRSKRLLVQVRQCVEGGLRLVA